MDPRSKAAIRAAGAYVGFKVYFMKAKDFKKFVAQIPDDAELTFTYSMWDFANVGKLLRGKEIVKYFMEEFGGFEEDDFKVADTDYMIEFKN